MKKFLSITLALCIILSLVCMQVNASESIPSSPSEFDIDVALVDRGYPQLVLEQMSISSKESIYNDTSLYFKGATILSYNEENRSFESYEIPADGIMPIGQIPVSDLSLVLLPQGVTGNNDVVEITCSYQWNKLPVFRWQDPIAVSWDSKIFEMVDDSFRRVDQYNGYIVDINTGIVTSWINGAIKTDDKGYAKGNANGVTWYADLTGYNLIGVQVSNLYGHGTFRLQKKTSCSGSTTLYMHYVHPTINFSPGINIDEYGIFSVTGIGAYDERGSQQTITY